MMEPPTQLAQGSVGPLLSAPLWAVLRSLVGGALNCPGWVLCSVPCLAVVLVGVGAWARHPPTPLGQRREMWDLQGWGSHCIVGFMNIIVGNFNQYTGC